MDATALGVWRGHTIAASVPAAATIDTHASADPNAHDVAPPITHQQSGTTMSVRGARGDETSRIPSVATAVA